MKNRNRTNGTREPGDTPTLEITTVDPERRTVERDVPVRSRIELRYGGTLIKRGTIIGQVSSTLLTKRQLDKALAAGVLTTEPLAE